MQWAVKLFPTDHVPSTYICVLGAGDVKVEVVDEARRGLRKSEDSRLLPLVRKGPSEESSTTKLPDFEELLAYLMEKRPA